MKVNPGNNFSKAEAEYTGIMFQDSRVLGKGKLGMNTRPLVQVRIFPFNLNVFK